MNKTKYLLPLFIVLSCGCSKEDLSIRKSDKTSIETRNYREDMRSFIINLSNYAKAKDSCFSIIPQNGIQLVADNGKPNNAYLKAIDGNGQEGLFYGYQKDDRATPTDVSSFLINNLKISQKSGNTIFITDYCYSSDKVFSAHKKNYPLNFRPFVATERSLNVIPLTNPSLFKENNEDIKRLNDAKNFLFFLNYDEYNSEQELINELSKTNYDVILMDMFFNNGKPFSKLAIEKLKTKANGGRRLIICYMSIGEAEDYRYYWKNQWDTQEPTWLEKENENWPGNFKVKYWDENWQKIIFGNEDAYLDKALLKSYNGVYLDIVDAFEYFENQ